MDQLKAQLKSNSNEDIKNVVKRGYWAHDVVPTRVQEGDYITIAVRQDLVDESSSMVIGKVGKILINADDTSWEDDEREYKVLVIFSEAMEIPDTPSLRIPGKGQSSVRYYDQQG